MGRKSKIEAQKTQYQRAEYPLKITFLGTRGYIESRTRRHYRHTSTLIEYRNTRVMIDCGLDWTKKVWVVKPNAIVITHAHPDHAFGLIEGSPCPVYATKQSWVTMENYAIQAKNRKIMIPNKLVKIGYLIFETFTVVHSIRAPAVGYRITAGQKNIFCVHDLISIDERSTALKKVQLYIGDGATLVRPMVRRRGDQLFGHTTIRAQLGWCQKEKISKMIVTHCGTQIVDGSRSATTKIKALAKERGVAVQVAYDGLKIEI